MLKKQKNLQRKCTIIVVCILLARLLCENLSLQYSLMLAVIVLEGWRANYFYRVSWYSKNCWFGFDSGNTLIAMIYHRIVDWRKHCWLLISISCWCWCFEVVRLIIIANVGTVDLWRVLCLFLKDYSNLHSCKLRKINIKYYYWNRSRHWWFTLLIWSSSKGTYSTLNWSFIRFSISV